MCEDGEINKKIKKDFNKINHLTCVFEKCHVNRKM